ncbi:MAG: hypothetical protein J2P28_02470 [Actinobacteria bacterium]|nr:hypothetical protein [Actinomycetota bacterium]
MSKAIGWLLIITLVIMLGTHPSSLAGLAHHALAVLQRAGDELSAFVSRLLAPGRRHPVTAPGASTSP